MPVPVGRERGVRRNENDKANQIVPHRTERKADENAEPVKFSFRRIVAFVGDDGM